MELKLVSSRKNVDTDKAPFFSNNRMMYGNSAPESGDYQVGDFIISNTQENGIFGWVCVETGNPGTWNIIGESNGKVRPYYNIVAFSDARSSVEIGIEEYDRDNDLLEVHYDGLLLVKDIHYRVSADGMSIEAIGNAWNQSADDNHEMAFRVLKSSFEVAPQNTVVVRLKNNVTTNREVSEVRIGITGFNQTRDILTVYKNSVYLIEGIDYEISSDGTKIICKDGSWKADNGLNYFVFESLKNVQIIPENTLVTMENLADDVKAAISAGGGGAGGEIQASQVIMSDGATDLQSSLETTWDWIEGNENWLSTVSDKVGYDALSTNSKTLTGAVNELYNLFNSQKEATINEINSLIDKI